MDKADVTTPSGFTTAGGVLRDTVLYSFRVEVKTTGALYYTLRSGDWLKLIQVSDRSGQIPIFAIEADIDQVPAKLAVVQTAFLAELVEGDPDPSIGLVKSIRLSASLLGHDESCIPHHRFCMKLPEKYLPRKGDVTALYYSDLLELLDL